MTDAQKLQALQDAIDGGVLEVRFQDRTVTYRSQADMERAYARIYARMNGANVIRQTRVSTSKGW